MLQTAQNDINLLQQVRVTDFIISRAITQHHQSLVYDADTLRDDYALLYKFVHKNDKP